MVLFEFTDSSVRMFTKHGVLCSYTSYCTVALEKKKKKKKKIVENILSDRSVKTQLQIVLFAAIDGYPISMCY